MPCHETKDARALERAYRRYGSADNFTAWKSQFKAQWRLFRQKNVRLLGDVDGVLRRWYQTAADINRAVKPLSTTRFPNTTWRNISRARSARSAPASRLPDRRPSLFASLQHFRCSLRWRTKIGLIIRRLVLTAPSKTYTLNPVPTWLVKRFVDLLARDIADSFNASLQTGYFSASQKQARVSARLKKPSMDPDDLNSFRPISNLTFLSKIVERVAVRQLVRRADENDLLQPRQSSYRRFCSTESALLVVYNDIVQTINASHVVALMLLDLSSAFNAVDHSILLSTLQSRFSVTGHPLVWFRSYLSSRTHVFVAQSLETPPVQLTSDVPPRI